jgi:multiple sugar transport system permease protein
MWDKMKKRTDILFLIPSLAGFMMFFVLPFFGSFYYAFTESAFTKKFVWLDNFKLLLLNKYFRLAMFNTLKFTAISVPLLMIFSIAVAVLISQYALKFPFVQNSFFIPILLPSASFVMFWQAYFNNIKPFESLLLFFLWKYAGFNVMLILTALCNVPKDSLEAAAIDGAGMFKKTYSILLPMISPAIFFTFTLSIVNSLKIFNESYLLYGTYPDESIYMMQNYLNNHFDKLNYQNISTASIFFALFVYTVIAVLFKLEHKINERIW